jgi:hypothetical protein
MLLLVNILVALTLLAAGGRGGRARALPRGAAILAAFPLLDAALLTAYVFGEDSYRHDGTSRWDAYRSPGGALGLMFVVSVALMVCGGALLTYAVLRPRNSLFRPTAVAVGVAALLLLTPTIIGFSTN